MVDFGIAMTPADYAIQPVALAEAVEARGFESLFFPEHTHIPLSTLYPVPGEELPKEYRHAHDPLVALAAAACVTRKIKLGTGVCLVVERDPIVLAKQVASLDLISGGRVVLGIGGGWNVGEMADHGVTDYKRRFVLLREKVLAMKEIWTKEAAEFHGEFVNFDPIWSFPKPVQPGGPPILMGGESRRNYARVVEYCNGWIPHPSPGVDMTARIRELREAAERANRPFASISLSAFRVAADEGVVEGLARAGFHRIVFGIRSDSREVILPWLDTCATLAAKFH
jgi:probable F420-dependent oxidoreductase